jgi:hypothetical protein
VNSRIGTLEASGLMREMQDRLSTDPELAAAYRERYSAPRRALAVTAIEQARDRGQLRPDVDAEAVVDQLWGACYHRLLIPDQPLTEAFARTLVDQLVRGLRAG